MNEKKRNARQLHAPFHLSYLTLFPIIIFFAGFIFVTAVQQARSDQRAYAQWLRKLQSERTRVGVIYYRVREFDTIESIAKEYDISVDTLVWANKFPVDGVRPGTIILIPPVTGVVHEVKSGETVESIAEEYGVDPKKIWNYPFNTFSDDPEFPITPGQILIVPDGSKSKEVDNFDYYRKVVGS